MKSLTEIRRDNERADTVTAQKLVKTHGRALVGQKVITPAMGDYPGGRAIVTELAPDPGAPEIVFTVKHPTVGEMGVFDYERVRLSDD